MYFTLCRVTGFFFITRTTLLVCSQLWIHSCTRPKQWTVNLGCGYPSNPTQIYPHHCYSPLSKLSPTRQRYLRNLNVLFQYSNIHFLFFFLPSMCFLFFFMVCVLRCFVCLVIVMSCTFDTTFKELVASSKTLRLSSR